MTAGCEGLSDEDIQARRNNALDLSGSWEVVEDRSVDIKSGDMTFSIENQGNKKYDILARIVRKGALTERERTLIEKASGVAEADFSAHFREFALGGATESGGSSPYPGLSRLFSKFRDYGGENISRDGGATGEVGISGVTVPVCSESFRIPAPPPLGQHEQQELSEKTWAFKYCLSGKVSKDEGGKMIMRGQLQLSLSWSGKLKNGADTAEFVDQTELNFTAEKK